VFLELGTDGYQHIGNGNSFEWKYAVAKRLQPKSILEIGVRFGYSLACFICASQSLEYVEGWDAEFYKEGSNEIAAKTLRELQYWVQIELKKQESSTVLALDRPFDLVHIDGSHVYETCMHDLELCIGKAKAILVDDTTGCIDDGKACRDFIAKHKAVVRDVCWIPSQVGECLILL
jgi:predicted O-methyltransferase YrrM